MRAVERLTDLNADLPSAADDAAAAPPIPTAVWRASFEQFERLIALDAADCDQALEALRDTQPDVYPHVLTLLAAHRDAREGGFMKTLAPDRGTGVAAAPWVPLEAGSVFGDYRLERPLGEGGMGEVWLARRADGLFEAPVALKLLHSHLSTSSVRERFLREGRILGELSHPNVAHLLDASAAPDGRLYLAIEYIDGRRIDDWCDAEDLDIPARLRLFVQVCAAVSHAHARLVVHRDLKPSNILINTDGAVKLLDFGIAKLIETTGQSAARTELTELHGRVLTPEYAAPEQVLGGPVTVATDVYSLGVLLFLLLTHRRPYGLDAMTSSQIEREVVDTEPLPPSRVVDGTVLRKRLTGDLDTITLKALKKAPAERYVSVLALAEDIERHLDNRPVLARPDSFTYRSRKFVRRNRLPVAAAAALALSLVAGVAGVLHQSHAAAQAEQRALEQAARVKRSKDFFVGIFAGASPLQRKGEAPQSLDDAVDQAIARIDSELSDDPRFQGDLLSDFGEIRAGQGDFPGAKRMFDRALALHEQYLAPNDPVLANTLQNRGSIDSYYANAADGLPYMERAVAILETHADSEPDALAHARLTLAQVLGQTGQQQAALRVVLSALESLRRSPGPEEMNLATALSTAGFLHKKLGQVREAAPYMREAVTVWDRVSGPDSPYVLTPLEVLSEAAGMDGDYVGQRAHAEHQLAAARKNFPEGGPFMVAAANNLAHVHRNAGRYAEAEALFHESAAIFERSIGKSGYAAITYGELGRLALERDAPTEAIALYERSMAICMPLPVEQRPDSACLGYEDIRVRTLLALNRAEEATVVIDEAVTKLRALGPDDAVALSQSLSVQAATHSAVGQHEAAVVAGREHLSMVEQAAPRTYGVSVARQHLALHLARWGGPKHGAESRRLMADAPAPGAPMTEFLPNYRMVQAELALLDGRHAAALKASREAVRLLQSRRPGRERDFRLASTLAQRAASP